MNIQTTIWFLYRDSRIQIKRAGRRPILSILPDIKDLLSIPSISAESLVLKAKKKSDSQYTILDSSHNFNFMDMLNKFDNAWQNPIMVTGMLCFPLVTNLFYFTLYLI
jgi:hypothetical protein